MSVLMRNGSWYSTAVASSGSSDSGGSGGTSNTNSTCSISSLNTMAISSTHGSVASPSHTLSPTDGALTHSLSDGDEGCELKLKNFTLDLNGDMKDHEITPPDVFSPSDVSSLDWGTREAGMQYGNFFVNKESLAQDLGTLSSMPELCDVTFLVGEGRQPVCGVRAILAARSRVFKNLLYKDFSVTVGGKRHKKKKHHVPSDGYVEKYDFRGEPKVIIKDFEPEVFKLLIDYTHTGGVILQSRTLLGLMNAADHFCLEELKQACIYSLERCITIETVCVFLTTAEKYIQYKSTKSLIQKILEFVDVNAMAILSLEDFVNLPQHIVRIVLGREELKISEIEKFEAAHRWSLRYCSTYPECNIKDAFEPFMDIIKYSRIPTRLLMQKVKKARVVDDTYLLAALAFQADPSSILPPRPLSAVVPAISTSASAILSRLQKMPTSPLINTGHVLSTGGFRRVQSSGSKVDFGVNYKTASSPASFFSSSILTDSRRARAGSAPLNVSEGDVHSPRRESGEELRLLESEVHPLCSCDTRDHIISSSSSHLSILSTPPLSPASSVSVISHQASLASVSCGDSGHGPTSPSGGLVNTVMSSGDVSSGSMQGKPGVPNMKILHYNYNPQALDAIVNLSSSNTVEL